MIRFIPLIICTIFALASCKRHYTASDFEEHTRDHRKVAILPFLIDMEGRIPKDWDEQRVEEELERESLLFQRSLMDYVLRSSHKSRGSFNVLFQSVNTTNNILEAQGYNHASLKKADPQELAQLLDADAVFVVQMRKRRFLSNAESWLVDQGMDVLRTQNLPIDVPGGLSRTNEIQLYGALVDAETGRVLHSNSGHQNADWNRPTEQVVAAVSRRIGRRFPYRIDARK